MGRGPQPEYKVRGLSIEEYPFSVLVVSNRAGPVSYCPGCLRTSSATFPPSSQRSRPATLCRYSCSVG
eukprot:12846-Eustigmatos_ZCMA.PRE.1